MRQARRKLGLALLGLLLAVLLTSCPSPLPWDTYFYYQPQGVCPNGVEIRVYSEYPKSICKFDFEDLNAYDCYPPFGQKPPRGWSYVFRQEGLYELGGPEPGDGYSFQADWTLSCLGSNRPPLTYDEIVQDPASPPGPTTVYILENAEAPSGIEIFVEHGLPPGYP